VETKDYNSPHHSPQRKCAGSGVDLRLVAQLGSGIGAGADGSNWHSGLPCKSTLPQQYWTHLCQAMLIVPGGSMKKRWLVQLVSAFLCVVIAGCSSDAGSDFSEDVKQADVSELAGEEDVVGPNDVVGGEDTLAETKDSMPWELAGDVPGPEDVQIDQTETLQPDDTTQDVCSPDCEDKVCGDNGCDGSCGECEEDFQCNDIGQCEPVSCEPDCSWKQCGNDGCDGNCGECEENFYCGPAFQCIPFDCTPECFAKECGWDGCSGSCGECQAGYECSDDGMCICIPDCQGKVCGDDGCGGSCGTCPGGETCQAGQCTGGSCWPNCGDDVLIPAGKFWMGCNAAVDTQCSSDESPYHEVYLDAYYIDRTEVTAADYAACVSGGGCTAPSSGSYSTYQVVGKEDHPINYVTWYQAEAYCTWAGKRLPTEAEWEKAARGTDGRKYPWGNETATCSYAVMYENGEYGCGTDSTWPVCSKSPAGDSPYGLCDMAGNVWEWTADWYSSSYYSSSPTNNPSGPTSGSNRVRRGGGFVYFYYDLRVSNRSVDYPSNVNDALGFRCARSE